MEVGQTSQEVMAASRQAVDLAIEAVKTYPPNRITPTTHVEDFLKAKGVGEDSELGEFVREVVYSSVRDDKMLKAVLKGLYSRHSGEVSRVDYHRYWVMGVLVLRKLEEMGFAEFKRFVTSQNPQRMFVFLTFLTGGATAQWLEDQLSRIYDIHYVQNELLGKLKSYQPQMDQLLERLKVLCNPSNLSEQIDLEKSGVGSTRQRNVTVPKPFALTKVAPKVSERPLTPIYIKKFKAKPVPDAVRNNTLQQVTKQNDERRERVMQQTKDELLHSVKPFSLETRHRQRKEEAAAKAAALAAASASPKFKAKSMPSFDRAPSPRYNVAAVLREEAALRKKADEEADRLKRFEMELTDDSEFQAWKRRMRDKDDREAKELFEQRREELARAAEDAKAAVEAKVAENHKLMLEEKEIAAQHERLRQERTAAQHKAHEAQRDAIAQGRQQAIKAKSDLAEQNAEEVQRQRRAKSARRRRVEKERAEEAARRKELIRQIQAMEKVAAVKGRAPREFDPTTASGVGVLEEMSLTELKERMGLMKLRNAERLRAKIEHINKGRSAKKKTIEAMLHEHKRLRAERARVAGEDREARRGRRRAEEVAHAEKLAQDEQKMADKLEEKRQVKRTRALQLAREMREKRRLENFELAAKGGGTVSVHDKRQVEAAAKHAEDMRRGLQRQEREREKAMLTERKLKEEAKTRDSEQRRANRAKEKLRTHKSRKRQDKQTSQILAETEEFQNAQMDRKQRQFKYIRGREKAAIAKKEERLPYAAKISGQETSKARALRKAREVLERLGGKRRGAGGQATLRLVSTAELQQRAGAPKAMAETLAATRLVGELADFGQALSDSEVEAEAEAVAVA